MRIRSSCVTSRGECCRGKAFAPSMPTRVIPSSPLHSSGPAACGRLPFWQSARPLAALVTIPLGRMRSSAGTPTGLEPDLWIVAFALVRAGRLHATACVAKRKPASTVSGEQSDRQPSAGASQPNAPRLASSTDADSAQGARAIGARRMLVTVRKQGVEQSGLLARRVPSQATLRMSAGRRMRRRARCEAAVGRVGSG